MVGRYNSNDPLNLNGGFAPPDPSLEDWQPPADQIPISGTGKDSRFLEDNMWATKPMRPKRANVAAYSTGFDTGASESSVTRKKEIQLDGTGTWGDWGVKSVVDTSPPPKNSKENSKKGSEMDASPVPRTIDGMNKVLKQRARAASAQTKAAYANSSPPAVVTKAKSTASNSNSAVSAQSPHHRNVPPHKRKILQATPTFALPSHAAGDPQANAIKTPPTTSNPEDVFAILQERLKQKDGAAASKFLPAHNTARNNTLAQGRPSRQQAPVLPPNPIKARPAPGNHFRVPATNARRPSSSTLVNGAESDDEAMARTLQAKEFGLRSQHIDDAQQIIEQELQHYKSEQKKAPSLSADTTGLYEKVHKVHEILWKQESMKLAAFAESKEKLFKMTEDEFRSYYAKVVSMHLAQWNARQGRVQEMMQMQAEMEASYGYSLDAILSMNGDQFNNAFENIAIAYSNKASGSNTRSSSDHQFILTEDDLICLEDGSEKDFDSDGFGLSGDEDDEDDGRIIFRGRG
ncbi:hypothetical protein SLS60_011897 [Paraconiothyrium brasiliense]|uniref:Uncharacterized protein n=1 Tax=Paraconiothyrium brasiliense TaxID=300254 RepID=A0ABR3QH69_9PLEO